MSQKKRVVVLATGGTIAGVGESGKDTGYVSGIVSGESLVASVPELAEYADVSVEQICNVNSDDITDKIWISLARRVAELQEDESVDGIVVTHGTDTMDETAYFLSLTVKCEKAVILTGSMKPSTAKNPDGPANLLGAVRTAAGFAVDDDPPENKVWVYFGGELFDARSVQKCSASALNPMGVNYPGEGSNWNALKEQNYFDVSGLDSLPRVNIVYFADPPRARYPERGPGPGPDMCRTASAAKGRSPFAPRPHGDGQGLRPQANLFAVARLFLTPCMYFL